MRNIAASIAVALVIWVVVHEGNDCVSVTDYGANPEYRQTVPPAKGGLAPPLRALEK